jgi:hypothetical protein
VTNHPACFGKLPSQVTNRMARNPDTTDTNHITTLFDEPGDEEIAIGTPAITARTGAAEAAVRRYMQMAGSSRTRPMGRLCAADEPEVHPLRA